MKFSNDLSKAIFLELRKPFNHSFFSFQIYFGFVLANFEAFFSTFSSRLLHPEIILYLTCFN